MGQGKKAEINLEEDAVYIVQNGRLITILPKISGKDLIIWKNRKVLDVEVSERVRVEGQEVI